MSVEGEVRDSTTRRERVGLDEALVSEVREALERRDTALATALARTLHPSDLADLIQLLEPHQRLLLLRALGPDVDPDTFAYLEESVREELLERLGPDWGGRIVAEGPPEAIAAHTESHTGRYLARIFPPAATPEAEREIA